MGLYDRAARRATKEEPCAVIKRLGEIAKARWSYEEWEPTQTDPKLQGRDQIADRVAKLLNLDESVKRWLAVLEFQAQHNPDKLDDILAECACFRRDLRHGPDRDRKFDVVPVLIYLVGSCPEDEQVLDMRTPGGLGIRHAPVVWHLCDDKADETLDAFQAGRITWGILFFVPLMKGADRKELVDRWFALVDAITDQEQKANLLGVAMVFAGLAERGQVWRLVLEKWNMTESPIVNEWIEQASQERELLAWREALAEVLKKKFPGKIQADVLETIDMQTSKKVLVDWVQQAAIAVTPEEFRNYLRR